jgi:GalNAc-alpha-(1->4)-GalNAc-alpha-(1->3)-diNAcBac-PP-undecaprenol alpha-1,4-N-acetyl-D-galactosaminyltransferase
MKILVITRLMSGFVSSVEKRIWMPEGAPAIYSLINKLDQSDHLLDIIFLLKSNENIPQNHLNKRASLIGLSVEPLIIQGPSFFPKFLGNIRYYLSEIYQYSILRKYLKHQKPDLVYIDRANVLLAAFLSRFHQIPVFLRLLGVPPSLQALLTKPAPSHFLYRWAYRSPFYTVLCSMDGSPGTSWMNKALNPIVPRHCWINGVDNVVHPPIQSKKIRIVLVARLNYLKQIDKAVKAILALPKTYLEKVHVDIIGDGDQRPNINKLINESIYSKKFTLHGAMPHDNVLSCMANSHIFISLNTHGNLTNTTLEAIRSGLCLILPEADKKSRIDSDTHQFIPKDTVVSLRLNQLESDLTNALQLLIDDPDQIKDRQRLSQKLSQKILSKHQRIKNEMRLLAPCDIAIVISSLRGGGTQKVLERLLPEWVNSGKRIVVITLCDGNSDQITLPILVTRIALNVESNAGNRLSGVFANIKRVRLIRAALKSQRPKKVLSFLTMTNILTIFATRRLATQLIICERNNPSKQSFGVAWDWLRTRFYTYADIVTANSHSACQALKEIVHETPCYHVPNPIACSHSVNPILLDRPTVLAVGRLHPQKAFDILIQAFSQFHSDFPDWQLVILGEGDLLNRLTALVAHLNLQNHVFFKGYCDPFPYYASATIFAMPSHFEGTPNALLEAMSMGMASVVSSAISDLNFLHEHENVLFSRVDDSASLVEQLKYLAENPIIRDKIAKQAQASVESFKLESVLPQWEAVLNA